MVPAAIKKQLLPVLQEGFVLKRSIFEECLELYPMEQWNAVMKRVGKLNPFKRQNNNFIRRFTAGVKIVEVDSNGRLLIPKDLIGFAGIEKEIVFSASVNNIIEIWDKQKYENVIDGGEDFVELTETVMGNVNGDELS